MGPLLFSVYINDLPKAIEHNALPILFADNTSMLLTSPNNIQKQSDLNILTEQLIKWFKSNLLFLNFDKTYFIQFNNKSRGTSEIQINYEDKQISIANETKFLGLSINNNNLSWKTHIECIKSKLSCSLHKDTTPPQPNHTVTPTHIEPEQYNPRNNSTNKSQAPEDGCTNIRNMLSSK